MPQSFAQLLTHLVFSTRGREPRIRPDERDALHAYLGGILRSCDSPSLAVGGPADHVHILFRLSKMRTLVSVIEDVKKSSSIWIKTHGPLYRDFHWQAGYGAFSVSASGVDSLVAYIAAQEQHHKKESYQEEVRRVLKAQGIAYDERYLWD